MRKCVVSGVALLAVLSFSLPSQASAQSLFLGGGATFPTGDFADVDGAGTGYLAIAGITFPFGMEGLSLLGEGFYGKNTHDTEGDATTPYGAMAGLVYDFAPEGEGGLYVFGQAGLMVHKYTSDMHGDDSTSGFGFGGGAGYGIPIGGLSGWVEGRYMQAATGDDVDWTDTTFFGVMAGISISLGGN